MPEAQTPLLPADAEPLLATLKQLDCQAGELDAACRDSFRRWTTKPADTSRRRNRLAGELKRFVQLAGDVLKSFDHANELARHLAGGSAPPSPQAAVAIDAVQQLQGKGFRDRVTHLRAMFGNQLDLCRQPFDTERVQKVVELVLPLFRDAALLRTQLTAVMERLRSTTDALADNSSPNQSFAHNRHAVEITFSDFLEGSSDHLKGVFSQGRKRSNTASVELICDRLQIYKECVAVFKIRLSGHLARGKHGKTWDPVSPEEVEKTWKWAQDHLTMVTEAHAALEFMHGAAYQIPTEAPGEAQAMRRLLEDLKAEKDDWADLCEAYERAERDRTDADTAPEPLPDWADLKGDLQRCIVLLHKEPAPLDRYELGKLLDMEDQVDTVRNWLFALIRFGICSRQQPDRAKGERKDKFLLTLAASVKYAPYVL